MNSNRLFLSVLSSVFALTSAAAFACPANPPTDFTDWLEGEIPTGPVGNGVQAEIKVNGLAAMGSAAGDSCAAAVQLPVGLTITKIRVVHAETGEAVGFEGFRPDALATRGFCGSQSRCTAFVSKVGKEGLKEDVPLTMILSATVDGMGTTRETADMAAKLIQEGVFSLGGANEKGLPHHHLSVFRTPPMRVILADRQEK